jgi:hypothetical protein
MNCIYKIYLNEDVYVGSTNDYNRRMMEHTSRCNNPNSKDYNTPVYQFIRDNRGWDNFKKEIIFETDKTGKELLELEKYYIETLKSNLNSFSPITTTEERKDKIKEQKKQYYQDNIEKLKEKNKEYKKNNQDKIKDYYENNKDKIKEYKKEKIKCEICNSMVSRNHLARHLKSKKCMSCK